MTAMGPVDVPLVCGHRMRVTEAQMPAPGILLWCGLCRDYTHRPYPPVINKHSEAVPGEWRWLCFTRARCNSGPHEYGQSYTDAAIGAYQHSHKYPLHEVWLVAPTGVVADRWGPDSPGAPVPLWQESEER